MGKATIKDVADFAGVSVGTVSRVLNDRPNVRAHTRSLVINAIKTLNYEPDAAARELSGSSGKTIGLNIAQGTPRLTPYFFVFFESLLRTVKAEGYRFEEIPNKSDGLPERLPDAAVLFGAHADDPRIEFFQKSGIPFVLIGHGREFSSVCPEDFDGGYQAGRHLSRLGHTDIVHIGSYLSYEASLDRYKGFKAALEEAGVYHDSSFIIDGGGSALDAYRALMRFFRLGKQFTAVFAGSDEMARGAIAAIEDMGKKVPYDFSVVGYDDLPEIGAGLTTIHQNIPLLVETAITLLQEQFKSLPHRHVDLSVQLVARDTTIRLS